MPSTDPTDPEYEPFFVPPVEDIVPGEYIEVYTELDVDFVAGVVVDIDDGKVALDNGETADLNDPACQYRVHS